MTFMVSKFAELLICLPFVVSGVQKASDVAAAADEVARLGLPFPQWTAFAVIALQIGAPLLILTGISKALPALALAGFTVAATFLAHGFWRTQDQVLRARQAEAFAEHLAIVGGLLLMAAIHTPGASL